MVVFLLRNNGNPQIFISERAKAIDEKFQKLKEVYTKLREEHINLIRQVSGDYLAITIVALRKLLFSISASVCLTLCDYFDAFLVPFIFNGISLVLWIGYFCYPSLHFSHFIRFLWVLDTDFKIFRPSMSPTIG